MFFSLAPEKEKKDHRRHSVGVRMFLIATVTCPCHRFRSAWSGSRALLPSLEIHPIAVKVVQW